MTNNIDRASKVIWTANNSDEGGLSATGSRHVAQALADATPPLLMPAPQVIRTAEELEALDQDTMLIRSAQDWADPQIPMLATEWASDWEIEPDGIFPLATIATAEQVRAARAALEEA